MSNSKPLIIRLNNLSDVEPMLIGNKGYNLGRLIQKGFKVPEGFVLTTKSYDYFLNFNELNNYIEDNLSKVAIKNIEKFGEIIKKE